RDALEHRHDVRRRELRSDPLVLAPYARAVRLLDGTPALAEQLLPVAGGALAQRGHVIHDLEQVAARRAAVDHLLERIRACTTCDAAELRRERHAATVPRRHAKRRR